MKEILIRCPLFLGLSDDEISLLLESTHHQIKEYHKDQIIAFAGDEVQNQLFILNGSVKGEMMDFSGKTIKIEDIEAPKPLAPAFLFGKNNKYPVNIIANDQVLILNISKDSFVKLLQQNEQILRNYLDIISNRAQFLSTKIKLLSFQTIKGKIANYLLQLHKKTQNITFMLSKSQSELAEMFGVTRPSLGRALREMDREGIIEAKGKKIIIIDKQRLSELLK